MADHWRTEGATVHHNSLDILTWPVLTGSLVTWPIWPWAAALWAYAPTPTAIYMAVSALFMLFQMCDKMGMLERFKRHSPGQEDD